MAEIHRPESQLVNGERALPSTLSETGSKRQRRPSVRLGDLGGDPPFDSHIRRSSSTSKQWKSSNLYLSKEKDSSGNGNSHSNHPNRSSKTRNVLHLNPPSAETLGLDGDENLDSFAIGSWKTRESSKKGQPAKKARPNQVSLFPYEGGEPDSDKCSAGEYLDDDEHPGFHMENSDSPLLKERSPENSWENLGLAVAVDTGRASSYLHRRPSTRTRSRSRDHHHDVSGPSDTDMRDGNGQFREDGVKIWLNGLGLGRYAPVFQIHEVDDEVLPLLTLEDLKDMGISAVGSRRKMYCAIQKLGKGFS